MTDAEKIERALALIQQKPPQQERDWFQRPRVPDNPNRSAGWDAQPEWSGASWSGERWSGRNWSGGRDR
jgi:hypothetical protein